MPVLLLPRPSGAPLTDSAGNHLITGQTVTYDTFGDGMKSSMGVSSTSTSTCAGSGTAGRLGRSQLRLQMPLLASSKVSTTASHGLMVASPSKLGVESYSTPRASTLGTTRGSFSPLRNLRRLTATMSARMSALAQHIVGGIGGLQLL